MNLQPDPVSQSMAEQLSVPRLFDDSPRGGIHIGGGGVGDGQTLGAQRIVGEGLCLEVAQPTDHPIAERAGVSVSTVSRALAGKAGVSSPRKHWVQFSSAPIRQFNMFMIGLPTN